MEIPHKIATTVLLLSLLGVIFSTGIYDFMVTPHVPISFAIFLGVFAVSGVCKLIFWVWE